MHRASDLSTKILVLCHAAISRVTHTMCRRRRFAHLPNVSLSRHSARNAAAGRFHAGASTPIPSISESLRLSGLGDHPAAGSAIFEGVARSDLRSNQFAHIIPERGIGDAGTEIGSCQ